MTLKSTFKQLVYYLPLPWQHVLWRNLFRIRQPDRFCELQEIRTMPENPRGYLLYQYDRYECIFVRIPKCATNSVAKSLFGQTGNGHHDIHRYQLIFGLKDFQRYFKFTFVRNPWDRFISAYTFLKGGGSNDGDKNWAEKNLRQYPDVNAFIKGWVTPSSIRSWKHFRPQYEFISHPHGQLLVDFIGKYENLAEDFQLVQERVGTNLKLVHINPTANRKRDYRSYYTDETAEIIGRVYERDNKLFGYHYDDFAPPRGDNGI